MTYKWIIYDNHIAIDAYNEILHPDAEDIYSFVNGTNMESDIPSPITEMPYIRFAKRGAPIKCEIYSEEGRIYFSTYALKGSEKFCIDIVDGHIIDQCTKDNKWFYVNGDIEYFQSLIDNAGILKNGEINVGQYLKLIKQEYFCQNKKIIDRVDVEVFKKLMDLTGDVPVEIKASLYEYQKTGYMWMKKILECSNGCILGDEMGLGKTLQVISLFQYMKNTHKMPVLVIAPVSLLENWKRECKKFAPNLDVYVHHGTHRTGRAKELLKHDVIVISYNTACSDLSMLRMIEWECVALDEAQNIKNPYSERAKSVKAITRKNSIAITGTPFENHITDIWSLVDFIIPDLLGSIANFENNITDDVLGAEKLEPVISPIMLRRLVKEVADDLPEKMIIPQPIEMSDEEKYKYCLYQKQIKSESENIRCISLAMLQKLRMFCTHPFLTDYEVDYDNVENKSIKYQRFCEIVEDIIDRKENVIVFTSYKKMFGIFQNDIPKRFGIEIDFINGDTPVEERQSIVDWFNNYEGSAMLVLNPRAAGTGLNITGANHVIHYNLEWNPALEDQASARAYRRGQVKTVFIYRLYYVDTVEQVVNDRIESKREISSVAVVGTDGVSNDNDDIIRALEIAPDIAKKG